MAPSGPERKVNYRFLFVVLLFPVLIFLVDVLASKKLFDFDVFFPLILSFVVFLVFIFKSNIAISMKVVSVFAFPLYLFALTGFFGQFHSGHMIKNGLPVPPLFGDGTRSNPEPCFWTRMHHEDNPETEIKDCFEDVKLVSETEKDCVGLKCDMVLISRVVVEKRDNQYRLSMVCTPGPVTDVDEKKWLFQHNGVLQSIVLEEIDPDSRVCVSPWTEKSTATKDCNLLSGEYGTGEGCSITCSENKQVSCIADNPKYIWLYRKKDNW